METESDVGIYSIKTVEELTGVPASTLRYWEKSYSVIVPKRNAGGQRLYSQQDVERIKWLQRKIDDEGIRAAVAHDMLSREMAKIGVIDAEASSESAVMILVAEKDPITAELEEYFLTQAGYAVHIVFDGRIAIEKAEVLKPDLIILDVILPGMSGLKVCTALKADPETADIPILVFSVLDVEERALNAGADAFLLKPIDHRQLVGVVSALLHRELVWGES